MAITIRAVQTPEDFHACEQLQYRVWAMADNLEVVPLHLLKTVQSNGGLLLGAFAGDVIVGFVFGFPGLTGEGKLKHCSHMLAVAPEYQSRSIGYRLKVAQREFALAQGLNLVTWTYDPLEGRNAYLNIHKLGAVCRTYIRDYYGELADGLNAGLPTDRLEVEWWIDSERVRKRLAGERGWVPEAPGSRVHSARPAPSGLLMPGTFLLDADAPSAMVEVPADSQAIKAADPDLALGWRLAIRQILEQYFAAGHIIVDLIIRQIEGERHCYYVLQRGPGLAGAVG